MVDTIKNLTMKCPYCEKKINPASIMGKESAKKRDTSSEAMSKLAKKRWEKVKKI